jgi:tetratricopeptide (TPR) repeat protein
MRQDYAAAMKLFAKAEKFYARIGDKASFAYTVWSMATVWKMRGEYPRSAAEFARAQRLFRETKDHRGLVYCRLGKGELAFLQGREQIARKDFLWSLEQAHHYGYHAEACHALMGLALVEPQPNWVAVKKAYRNCGLYFTPLPPPLNLP